MWKYEKKLQYSVKIKNPNPAMAKIIISQFGGPNGELGAATRYLSQRFTAPSNEIKGLLTDIGISWEEMLPNYSKGVLAVGGISWGEMPLFSSKGVLAVGGTEASVMLPPQNIITDKHCSRILIHTIRSNEVLARYSKKNQFDTETASNKKESHQEKIIRIFA